MATSNMHSVQARAQVILDHDLAGCCYLGMCGEDRWQRAHAGETAPRSDPLNLLTSAIQHVRRQERRAKGEFQYRCYNEAAQILDSLRWLVFFTRVKP